MGSFSDKPDISDLIEKHMHRIGKLTDRINACADVIHDLMREIEYLLRYDASDDDKKRICHIEHQIAHAEEIRRGVENQKYVAISVAYHDIMLYT